jgi:hypothetical protein
VPKSIDVAKRKEKHKETGQLKVSIAEISEKRNVPS